MGPVDEQIAQLESAIKQIDNEMEEDIRSLREAYRSRREGVVKEKARLVRQKRQTGWHSYFSTAIDELVKAWDWELQPTGKKGCPDKDYHRTAMQEIELPRIGKASIALGASVEKLWSTESSLYCFTSVTVFLEGANIKKTIVLYNSPMRSSGDVRKSTLASLKDLQQKSRSGDVPKLDFQAIAEQTAVRSRR